MSNTETTEATAPVQAPLTRDEIRAKVFGAKPKTEKVTDFFGAEVEIRQPELGIVLETRTEDQSNQVSRMLIDYTFVPGTNEKVFEAADVDSILQIPFGEEMKRYIDVMNKILGVDAAQIEAEVKDATKSR